jgi:hypothetical protein
VSVVLGIVVIALIVVSVNAGSDTTTTTAASVTTTLPATTTSTAESTTSTEPPTTSSTTTVPETTTSVDDGLLEGNWAIEPLIAATFGAAGWWDGAGWVQAEIEGPLPVSGGEDYQVAQLGVEGIISAGGEEDVCGIPVVGVVFDDDEPLGRYGVGISAPWPMYPHLVEVGEDDGTMAAVASGLLAERGLTVPDPVIKQLLRVDLEGDGVNEVIVVAEDVPDELYGEPGDYSLAFMQRVVNGAEQSIVFGESVIVELAEDELFGFLLSFEVGAVADLSGDGKMEIVLGGQYYEGVGIEVWEYVDDELGLVNRIGAGCGA